MNHLGIYVINIRVSFENNESEKGLAKNFFHSLNNYWGEITCIIG